MSGVVWVSVLMWVLIRRHIITYNLRSFVEINASGYHVERSDYKKSSNTLPLKYKEKKKSTT